jgi:hypothetical protein
MTCGDVSERGGLERSMCSCPAFCSAIAVRLLCFGMLFDGGLVSRVVISVGYHELQQQLSTRSSSYAQMHAVVLNRSGEKHASVHNWNV